MNNIEKLKNEIDIKKKELLQLEEQLKHIHEFEGIAILRIDTNIKKFEEIKRKIKDITSPKEFEELGTKKLAYDIKGQKEGFYIRYEFEGVENTVTQLESYFRINNNILKFITIRHDGEE